MLILIWLSVCLNLFTCLVKTQTFIYYYFIQQIFLTTFIKKIPKKKLIVSWSPLAHFCGKRHMFRDAHNRFVVWYIYFKYYWTNTFFWTNIEQLSCCCDVRTVCSHQSRDQQKHQSVLSPGACRLSSTSERTLLFVNFCRIQVAKWTVAKAPPAAHNQFLRIQLWGFMLTSLQTGQDRRYRSIS